MGSLHRCGPCEKQVSKLSRRVASVVLASCTFQSDKLVLTKFNSRGSNFHFMSTEPNKVIYSMVGVSKFYDKKAVLKNIYLSYFYGAKIGVIGLNGSGKSS